MGVNAKIGLAGLGLDTYWGQFRDLKEHLISYQRSIASRMIEVGGEVIDVGLVDNVELARGAHDRLREAGVDVVFLYIATYALSSTVLPLVRGLDVPVVLLNLQPTPQLDYEKFNSLGDRGLMTGIWLENCQACSVPEIACVFNRAGIAYDMVSGYLTDETAWREIECWIVAAGAARALRSCNIGVLGHYYCGMLDVYSDMTALSSAFGCHFELLEFCRLSELRNRVEPEQVAAKLREFEEKFIVDSGCGNDELERAGRTSCALDELVKSAGLDAMAYYYESTSGNPYQDIVTSVIAGNTLLTGAHVPVAGECEIRNVIAMKIMDILGSGGSFSELYLADYQDDVIYFGHDGPAHFAIAEGRVGLVPVPVYHGKPGKGLSIQMTVKHGPVTLLAVVQGAAGEISLLTAEGESVPGPVLQIGNTNSRYRFPQGVKAFLAEWSKAGPAHHCAIGVGRRAAEIEKLARVLDIRFCRIA